MYVFFGSFLGRCLFRDRPSNDQVQEEKDQVCDKQGA